MNWMFATTWFNNAGPLVRCTDGTMRCQTDADFSWDVSVIQYDTDLSGKYGSLGFGYGCGDQTYTVTSAGYPGERGVPLQPSLQPALPERPALPCCCQLGGSCRRLPLTQGLILSGWLE